MPTVKRSDAGRSKLELARAVKVTHVRRSGRSETYVVVRDQFGGSESGVWRVETGAHRLPADLFGDVARRKNVQRTRHKDKGRVIYLLETPRDVPLAAVCFHVDPVRGAPIVVQDVALRTDAADSRAASLAGARLLLSYLFEVSAADSRPRAVGVTLELTEDGSLWRSLGFRPARRPASLRGGPIYLEARPGENSVRDDS